MEAWLIGFDVLLLLGKLANVMDLILHAVRAEALLKPGHLGRTLRDDFRQFRVRLLLHVCGLQISQSKVFGGWRVAVSVRPMASRAAQLKGSGRIGGVRRRCC